MKIIKNGKSYDTNTATCIGSFANAGNWRDFNHYEETLYRKRTGEYFLHGEGGAMTCYSKTIGQNEWSGGEKIIPMSYAEAKEWAEENLTAEEYEAEFGEVAEDEGKEFLHITMDAQLTNALRKKASEDGMSLSAKIEAICADAVR